MFIQLNHPDKYVNLDHVARVDQRNNGTFATMRNGDVVELSILPHSDFEGAAAQVVKANPGFEVVQAFKDGDQVWVDHDPVIAWRVGTNYVFPVSVERSRSDIETASNWGIKYPDGRVMVSFDSIYDSEDAWLKTCREKMINKISA